MKTKRIKQIVNIKASPIKVYEALMDSKKHAEFTGYPAKISNKVGGEFMASGDYIHGKNLELHPGKKIVQEWRAADWPEGHRSKVIFKLNKTKAGTRLTFIHERLPAEFVDSISDGWRDYYWVPLKQYLER